MQLRGAANNRVFINVDRHELRQASRVCESTQQKRSLVRIAAAQVHELTRTGYCRQLASMTGKNFALQTS